MAGKVHVKGKAGETRAAWRESAAQESGSEALLDYYFVTRVTHLRDCNLADKD